MPLPYSNCVAELPSNKTATNTMNAFRSFVVERLMKRGYAAAAESTLDILTDVVMCEVKKIGSEVASNLRCNKGSRASAVDVTKRVLQSKYDLYLSNKQ